MRKRDRSWIAATGLLLMLTGFASTSARAQNPNGTEPYELLQSNKRLLSVGDKAPPLTVAECLIGDEPTIGDSKVVVVEFWATWCQPYVAIMAQRTELQQRFKDRVQIIAITAEPKPTLSRFLESEGDYGRKREEVFDFAVAIDKDDATSDRYVQGSGAPRLPVSFIIGEDGKIEWMGDPAGLSQVLQSVLEGAWDREAYRLLLAGERRKIQQLAKDRQRIEEAAREKDWDAAFEILDKIIADHPGLPEPMMVKATYLRRAGWRDRAVLLVEEVVEDCWDDHIRLAMIAAFLSEHVLPGDAALAVEVAKRACDLRPQRAEYWSLLARAEQLSGDLASALVSQRKALTLDPGSRRRAEQLMVLEELASQQ